jgi:hypothetical protein
MLEDYRLARVLVGEPASTSPEHALWPLTRNRDHSPTTRRSAAG